MVFNARGIWKTLGRKKFVDQSFESPLRRCLVFVDLFLLGVGGSVDVALYIVLGNVIRDLSGPSVLISMVPTFFVCLGSGFCYAEFASYIPTSGSDYDYVYSSLGEICGFFDGWSILVSSVLATAVLAQGAGDLLSSLTNSASYEYFDSHVELPEHSLLASNLNVMATLIVVLVTIITAIGVQGSIRFNGVIVVINILVVVFTFILGLFYINFDNWSSWDKFAPYGATGILDALPVVLFFYGGFVSVTFSSEEVINPHQILPKSIVASLVGIFVLFMMIAFVLGLVIPYDQLPKVSPLSDAFGNVAFKESKYIIAVGGFCSCFSSVLTASYANSRLAYVISRDGLISRFLSKVNKRMQVPINAVLTTGLIACVLAAFLDLTILVEMCSILTVVPYILLLFSVILPRYKEILPHKEPKEDELSVDAIDTIHDGSVSLSPSSVETETKIKPKIIVALVMLILSTTALSLLVRFSVSYNVDKVVFGILAAVFLIPLMLSFLVIYKTPYEKLVFPFTMPCFPLLPATCLVMCVFIMLQFSMWAWILFCCNSVLGKFKVHLMPQRPCYMVQLFTYVFSQCL